MPDRRILALALGLAAAAALAARADAAAFGAKPGLWEVTTSGTASGAPPIPPEALARLSPEEKAKFLAAMQEMMARQNARHVTKSCLTAEQLQRGPTFTSRRDKSCKETVAKSTATDIDVNEVCRESGRQTMSGRLRFHATSPQTIVGTADVTVGDGTRTMRMHREINAKWLRADCGAVKPGDR
ncbi:MAG TPA: DUF3617 domain-containing protein [Stellaceae bacterium]|nr:DUF3617 domain-containing protein [Stellaceae bacterium]